MTNFQHGNKEGYENSEDEITLKMLILTARNFANEIIKNWWLIVLIAIPFIAFAIYQTFSTPPKYNSEIRFIVEGQDGGSFSGLGGILGSFGLGKGKGSNNNSKILEVAKSKRLISSTLFDKNEEQDYLGNEIISTYQLDEIWKEKLPEFENFRFSKDSISEFTMLERKALLRLIRKFQKIKGVGITSIEHEEDSGVFSIQASSISESLSIRAVKVYYSKLKVFFEEQTLADKLATRDLMKEKSDSLLALVNYKTRQLARFEDTNRGLVSSESKINRSKIITEIDGISNAYKEVSKSYEIADFTLRANKPFFLIIDEPLAPLSPEVQSLFRNLIMAIFIGCFIGAGFVVLRRIYRLAMSENI